MICLRFNRNPDSYREQGFTQSAQIFLATD